MQLQAVDKTPISCAWLARAHRQQGLENAAVATSVYERVFDLAMNNLPAVVGELLVCPPLRACWTSGLLFASHTHSHTPCPRSAFAPAAMPSWNPLHITMLDLSNSHLREFWVSDFAQLLSLRLFNNQISSLAHSGLEHCPLLGQLDLRNNLLSISDELCLLLCAVALGSFASLLLANVFPRSFPFPFFFLPQLFAAYFPRGTGRKSAWFVPPERHPPHQVFTTIGIFAGRASDRRCSREHGRTARLAAPVCGRSRRRCGRRKQAQVRRRGSACAWCRQRWPFPSTVFWLTCMCMANLRLLRQMANATFGIRRSRFGKQTLLAFAAQFPPVLGQSPPMAAFTPFGSEWKSAPRNLRVEPIGALASAQLERVRQFGTT